MHILFLLFIEENKEGVFKGVVIIYQLHHPHQQWLLLPVLPSQSLFSQSRLADIALCCIMSSDKEVATFLPSTWAAPVIFPPPTIARPKISCSGLGCSPFCASWVSVCPFVPVCPFDKRSLCEVSGSFVSPLGKDGSHGAPGYPPDLHRKSSDGTFSSSHSHLDLVVFTAF